MSQNEPKFSVTKSGNAMVVRLVGPRITDQV